MSDERLREAERRWKESGLVEDDARYLLERVRVGDLTRERLELAAYCGHAGARTALGGATEAAPSDVTEWAKGLVRWGKPTCVLLALLSARHACEFSARRHPVDSALNTPLKVVEHWLTTRTPEDEDLAANIADQLGAEAATRDDSVWLTARLAIRAVAMKQEPNAPIVVGGSLNQSDASHWAAELQAAGARIESRVHPDGTQTLMLVEAGKPEPRTITTVARLLKTSTARATQVVRQLRLGTYDYLAVQAMLAASDVDPDWPTLVRRRMIDTQLGREPLNHGSGSGMGLNVPGPT